MCSVPPPPTADVSRLSTHTGSGLALSKSLCLKDGGDKGLRVQTPMVSLALAEPVRLRAMRSGKTGRLRVGLAALCCRVLQEGRFCHCGPKLFPSQWCCLGLRSWAAWSSVPCWAAAGPAAGAGPGRAGAGTPSTVCFGLRGTVRAPGWVVGGSPGDGGCGSLSRPFSGFCA